MSTFAERFVFNPTKILFVGVEREYFLVNDVGDIVPRAKQVMDKAGMFVRGESCFGPDAWQQDESVSYELSACQIESRIGPCKLSNLKECLEYRQDRMKRYVDKAGKGEVLNLSCVEVAPETMPLDVYPDPSGRYQQILKYMPKEVLLAACRVIGTHIHIGMPDHTTALRAYNEAVKYTHELCKMGDKSNGKRLEIYKQVAVDCIPMQYATWSDFHDKAVEKGFDSDPRKCWTLIRISKHGTIEFRMFGSTDCVDEIVGWAEKCHSICKEVV